MFMLTTTIHCSKEHFAGIQSSCVYFCLLVQTYMHTENALLQQHLKTVIVKLSKCF